MLQNTQRTKFQKMLNLLMNLWEQNSLVLYSNETCGTIDTLEESSLKTGMANANRKYRQLYVI